MRRARRRTAHDALDMTEEGKQQVTSQQRQVAGQLCSPKQFRPAQGWKPLRGRKRVRRRSTWESGFAPAALVCVDVVVQRADAQVVGHALVAAQGGREGCDAKAPTLSPQGCGTRAASTPRAGGAMQAREGP